MPDASGAILVRQLQQSHASIPILLMTGYADAARDMLAEVPRLRKPFRATDLTEKLGQLLGARQGSTERDNAQ